MKRTTISVAVVILFLLSLFPTWNFSEHISIRINRNPLWTENNQEVISPLTDDLKRQGYVFQTNRGAEADPDGICFGYFKRDEYWVIQYRADRQEVEAYSWVIGLNWLGHLFATSRFWKMERSLRQHIK